MAGRWRRGAGETQLGGSHAGWEGECTLGGLMCYEYGQDSDTLKNMAVNIFVALVIAWAAAVVCAYAAKAGGRTRWSFYWVGSLMGCLCCVQYYFIFLAANTVPPSSVESYVRRYDCMNSNKGGKRNKDGNKNAPGTLQHPCFCHAHARCFDEATGAEIFHADCPTDGSAKCYEGNGDGVPMTASKRLISIHKDCTHGRNDECSKKQPCTPCELDRVIQFKDASYCTLCSDINTGKCHFKKGVGPYCWERAGSDAVVPCETCCTAATTTFEVRSFNHTTDAFNVTTYLNYTHCDVPIHPGWTGKL